MKLFITNICFAIISLYMVLSAPPYYSYTFNILIGIFFLTQNFIYFLLQKKITLVSFEFFFMISFGITNFIYPIFYYPTQPDYAIFAYSYNTNIISKSTALAFVAYSFLLLGLSIVKRNKTTTEIYPIFSISVETLNNIVKFSVVSFLLFVVSGGISAIRNVYSGDGNINEVGIYSYFNILFTISCSLFSMFIFRQINKTRILLHFILLCCFLLIFLSTGTRGNIVGIVIILIFTYNSYVKQISNVKLLIIMVVGIITLLFIAFARSTNIAEGNWLETANSKAEINSFLDVFSDLIVNNRNLYVLVDFADNVNRTYFLGFISDLLSPIPGAFSYIASVSGMPIELMTAGALPTFLEFGPGSSFGLGTNLVGEAYVSFGLIGVIIIFYLMGEIIGRYRSRSESSIYSYVIYLMFISMVIGYPRSSVFTIVRPLVWGLLLLFIVNKFSLRKSAMQDL